MIPFTWSGEAMEPRRNFRKLCDERFVVGQQYLLDAIEERSAASHRHYFAEINTAWANLPEHLTERWPSSEHLRKAALIKAGYRDERTLVASSKAEAQRLAAFVRPMDEYAVVSVSGSTVVVLTAQSQSMRSMGKARFEESKRAVLDILADLIGVETKELEAAS